ncbi:DUF6501 family protein [Gracilibacillus sp. D59]|uniref:DUF6501 family protein n=1 Tax=Gracilibacillus sp. D59 TaxID=3457434 RepID=UPI003FCD2987
MIHQNWENNHTIKKIKCVHTNAKKYKVNSVLTEGKIYEVKNETDEFYFVIDNTSRIAGFKKDYFEIVQ